jgi:hypothetical protein
MKVFVIAILAALLTGCASQQVHFNLDNRVVCTVARDKAYVVSDSTPAGISLVIAEADRAVICAK